MIYRFEDAELNCDTFELLVRGDRVPVEPQVFEVIRYLIEHRERMCTRTEILDNVWGDRFVSDSALASRIAAARAAVADDGRAQRVIRTVHGRGFQFVAPVVVGHATESPPSLIVDRRHDDLRQSIRFCQAPDGVHLAVAEVGDGPPLVKAANWLTHVEHDWHSPVWRHWLVELGCRFRYIRYDARGGGLSDRDLTGSRIDELDTWTGDLETAVECSDLSRFVLFAMSQGTGPALDYCVRHPDRVSRLIVLGGYVRGMRGRDADSAAQAALLPDLIRVGWGGSNWAFRSVFTTTFVPEATSEQMRWFTDLAVHTASADNAVRLETAFHNHDFTELARAITVPTLVMHATNDRAVPFSEGRLLASLVPGARFVPLDSANHILLEGEPAWAEFLRHVDEFTAAG